MSTPTKQHAKRECERLLSACPILSPRDEAAATIQAREITDALLRNCQDNEHISSTVTAFLESAIRCQNPIAELVQIARSTEKADVAPAGCSECALDPDYLTGAARWADHLWRERADGTTYAVRCAGPTGGPPCPRGAWMAKQDEERRKASKATKKPQAHRADHEHLADVDWARRAAGERQ